MSKSINDGGPAFPGFDYISQDGRTNPQGMSLRDWLAGQVVQGLLVRRDEFGSSLADCASMAYDVADIMIKKREVKPLKP